MAEVVNLCVSEEGNRKFYFKMRMKTKLGKLMKTYCAHKGYNPATVRFIFDGERIGDDCTPSSLEMEDGDTIDVHMAKVGGGDLPRSSAVDFDRTTGKRRRGVAIHKDAAGRNCARVLNEEEDREVISEEARETMYDDVMDAMWLVKKLGSHRDHAKTAHTGLWQTLAPTTDEVSGSDLMRDCTMRFVLGLAEGIRKRRLDFVSTADTR